MPVPLANYNIEQGHIFSDYAETLLGKALLKENVEINNVYHVDIESIPYDPFLPPLVFLTPEPLAFGSEVADLVVTVVDGGMMK